MSRRLWSMHGAALIEFALAWPVVLLVVLGSVETAVWGSEAFAARSAALAGARAGAVVGSNPEVAVGVTIRTLSPSLVGVSASAWCPGDSHRVPAVWVCARDLGVSIEVKVGGVVPGLVPVVNFRGLPLEAHAVVQKEAFAR